MDLTRRRFLAAGSGLAVAAGAAACTAEVAATETPFDPADWASVREQFPLTREVRQFSAYVLAAPPRPVNDAINRHRAGLDRDTHAYLDAQAGPAVDAVRTAAAEYLGGRAEDIALTDSTTMGLGLLYAGIRLLPGQQVLTTEHDFYSTHHALKLRGVEVHRVRLYDTAAAASAEEMVARLRAGLTPQTRIVAITWVHSVTGVKLPVRAIADAIAAHNASLPPGQHALLCVDAVHALGVEAATPADLGCDFLISGTHKWLFGPRGTGVIWARQGAWEATAPVLPSFSGPAFDEWLNGTPTGPTTAEVFTPGGYHSFEYRWALAEAFRFHLAIGRDRVQARTRAQVERVQAELRSNPSITVVTPAAPELSAGIICFDVADTPPQAVVAALAGKGVSASVTPYNERHVRVGPSIVTSDEDVDALIRALRP
ncbi:aminotransferase class V-fold PLP-dependent enzyme [Actinokineospora globicatena]|uniref:aminotransferase class V-fold PLP-dependent enzyme n=1 Tax=Actinokineospora globicatena TaxID=103729 RepID=UPI0020A51837|nr:aminotransferase class V-fold PLP-dependent enzyme [Actinokineospora globicatena]MCP2302337.1 Selenocysteine lyase/Cysteine desulfurase [Actinokineospora globicatena]GLW75992.1 class V aminotransferase [Actinokineospora globicatena]GLW82831.1 class V aminotransferase [Actinokineospora globicatena]